MDLPILIVDGLIEAMKEYKDLKEAGYSICIYQHKLNKACFQQNMVYGDVTVSSKIWWISGDKKSSNGPVKHVDKSIVKNEILLSQRLAEKLNKTVTRKLKKQKVYSSFKDTTWGADIADMESLNKCCKRFQFLLCVIDIYSKYEWVVPLKSKNHIRMINSFQNFLNESWHRSNKAWVDKGNEFYNMSMKLWFCWYWNIFNT